MKVALHFGATFRKYFKNGEKSLFFAETIILPLQPYYSVCLIIVAHSSGKNQSSVMEYFPCVQKVPDSIQVVLEITPI